MDLPAFFVWPPLDTQAFSLVYASIWDFFLEGLDWEPWVKRAAVVSLFVIPIAFFLDPSTGVLPYVVDFG